MPYIYLHIYIYLNEFCLCFKFSTLPQWNGRYASANKICCKMMLLLLHCECIEIGSVLVTYECRQNLIKILWMSATCYSRYSIPINHRYAGLQGICKNQIFFLFPFVTLVASWFFTFRKSCFYLSFSFLTFGRRT